MQQSPTKNHRTVSIWLWTGAGLILLMLVIGGITRLTGSGLSITEWNLLLGTFPPADQAAWTEAFNQYKQYPEYRQLNAGMTLTEFKGIYFWEYLHRLTGRLIGVVFLGPFLWFWYRGYFEKAHLKRLSILFLLGGAQGVLGWIMVKSGLTELPFVSHYRLALHLVLGFMLFGFCVWLALDLGQGHRPYIRVRNPDGEASGHMPWMYGIAAILLLQIVWGAFVAGLNAGSMYNSFPLMNDSFMPGNAWALEPLLLNLVENPGLVQWSHRILGTALALVVIAFWIRTAWRSTGKTVRYAVHALLVLVLIQYLLGVFTLVYNVPVVLGVAHQVLALLIFGAWIVLLHAMSRAKKKLPINQIK